MAYDAGIPRKIQIMKHDTLLFVSGNLHKLDEIKKLIPSSVQIIGLKDIGFNEDIPEPFDTFEANARAKTSFMVERTGTPCFADDSGLVVDALDGRPGVYSARYAGPAAAAGEHMQKVLHELGDNTKRTARFVSVIAYQPNANDCYYFKGMIEGTISFQPLGDHGFGYDPIFIPAGFDQTFGELPSALKNRMSHRALAMQKWIAFLASRKN